MVDQIPQEEEEEETPDHHPCGKVEDVLKWVGDRSLDHVHLQEFTECQYHQVKSGGVKESEQVSD